MHVCVSAGRNRTHTMSALDPAPLMQVGDWSTSMSLTDHAYILDGCKALLPSLAHAEVLEDWVGLRPGRSSVRLELDQQQIKVRGPRGQAGSSRA